MITTVISDLGNVILFFDNGIFFKKMTAYCDHSEKQIRELARVHFGLVILFDSGKISPHEFYKGTVDRLGARISEAEFYSVYCDVFWLNSPVFEILKKLRGKYSLVLLSNTDICRFAFIKRRFPEILIFDHRVLSFELGILKPDPAIYFTALEKAGVRAEESVFIDDLQENIDGAGKVGIQGILYDRETDLETQLAALGLQLS
jgi:FMN phosphatase YigB (HAD superfamily)